MDLVAEDGDVLVFVEVKCRTASSYGPPRNAITAAKRRKLARTASHYLMENVANDRAYRADIVEVALVGGRVAGVRVTRGAFSIERELERMS
jgi:putative endonuclease